MFSNFFALLFSVFGAYQRAEVLFLLELHDSLKVTLGSRFSTYGAM
jgi:hypothetical protein